MSDTEELVFEAALDAPVEKVWRALTIPEYLERWLQPPPDARLELVTETDGGTLTYRLLERDEESFVTFEITPREDGGTHFRLTHRPATMVAANSNVAAPTAVLRAA